MDNEICKISINGEEISDCYSDLISLEVEEDMELASVCNLRLAVPFDSNGNWKWIDNEVFNLWDKITITAGFADSTEDIFTGFITHINTSFDDSIAQSYLDVRSMDESVKMNLVDIVNDWPNKKDSDIANEIFNGYGFQTEVLPTEIVHDEAISTIIQNETDMQFLERLAKRNGFECFVRNSTGYFKPIEFSGETQKVLAVNFGSESNVSTIQFEINGLSSANIELHQLNPLTREAMDVEVTSATHKKLGKQDNPALLQSGFQPASKILSQLRFGDYASMQAYGQTLVNIGDWMVTGEGEIIGKYYQSVLRAREFVTIKGVGEIYSGNYLVTRVKHHFSEEGYTQHFGVKRNAIYPEGSEAFVNSDLL